MGQPILATKNIMKNKNKIIVLSSTAAAAVLGLGAFALFTDNDTEGMTSKGGTVEVDIGDLEMTNPMNINPGDNDEDIPDSYIPDPDDPVTKDPDYEPGTPVEIPTTDHDLTFTVTNNGTKSIRTRHTLIITCKDTEGEVLDPSYLHFKLDDTHEIGSEAGLGHKWYVLDDGTEVESLDAVGEDRSVVAIKYQMTPDIFDGVGEAAEVEENSTVHAVDGVCSQDYKYLFKMDADTPNTYQGAEISIDVVVEAMQYRNTGATDWELMSTNTVTGTVTGVGQTTVPNKSEEPVTSTEETDTVEQ